MALEPGDAVTLDVNGQSHLVRITGIGDHGARDIEARSIDPAVYAAAPPAARADTSAEVSAVGQPLVVCLDIPPLSTSDPEYTGYAAAAQVPWPGTIAVYRAPGQSGFALKAMLPVPAVTGVTRSVLLAGPEGRMDYANALTVEIDRGELTSTTALDLLGGVNAAAIETAPGEWEIIQFRSARLTATRTYELSILLRAQRGSDGNVAATVPAGARFVLLDGALRPVDMTRDDVGLTFNWKSGPANRDIGHASFVSQSHTFRGTGLRPYSPAHIRGTRNNGDVTITWQRRTRAGGDSWDTPDVPLGEDSERYEIDILSGATVKRTLASTTPTATYSAASQTTDFGTPQSSLTIRVHQLSPTAGRGTGRIATV
jgi:hypothetical protein